MFTHTVLGYSVAMQICLHATVVIINSCTVAQLLQHQTLHLCSAVSKSAQAFYSAFLQFSQMQKMSTSL